MKRYYLFQAKCKWLLVSVRARAECRSVDWSSTSLSAVILFYFILFFSFLVVPHPPKFSNWQTDKPVKKNQKKCDSRRMLTNCGRCSKSRPPPVSNWGLTHFSLSLSLSLLSSLPLSHQLHRITDQQFCWKSLDVIQQFSHCVSISFLPHDLDKLVSLVDGIDNYCSIRTSWNLLFVFMYLWEWKVNRFLRTVYVIKCMTLRSFLLWIHT